MTRNDLPEQEPVGQDDVTLIPHDGRRRVYEHVRRAGPVDVTDLRQALFPDSPRALRYHLCQLRRRGLVTIDGDRVRHSLDLASLASTTCVDLPAIDGHVVLRPATLTDHDALRDLLQAAATRDRYVAGASLSHILDPSEGRIQWESRDVGALYVATVEAVVCGWVHVNRCPTQYQRHTAELSGGVHADWRRRGLGSALLSHAVDWTLQGDVERLVQTLAATNDAGIEFLTARGWTIDATLTDAYCIDGDLVDAVRLTTSSADATRTSA